MVSHRRPLGQHGGMTTKSWLALTLVFLYTTTVSAKSSAGVETVSGPVIASGSDPPILSRKSHAGRSPAEIPLLNHDAPTAKFRSTNEEIQEYEYQALAPARERFAVRAPATQPSEPSGLLPLNQARLLSDWEADDILLLSTIDGALHARDRRTGRQRWTLEMPDTPMIETVHYQQNTSLYELANQEDFIFIVEPSKDGQLYAQYADPKVGLVRIPGATVRKMATQVPFSMKVNDQVMHTTSETQVKTYTVDAQTGDVLHEFPRSKAAIKSDSQPRCRPRTGFDLDDSACKPGRTLRLSRRTYTFTISNEDTMQDICTIRFSEWVTSIGDDDLEAQHRSSMDGYDVRIFHDGLVMGLDTTDEPDRQHRYRYMLDSPVARVFDIVRKHDADDDITDLIALSRGPEFQTWNRMAPLQPDFQQDQRVFVNCTDEGQWYAMSELSYPGVTIMANPAKVQHPDFQEQLNLHGDLKDIVGVHRLAGKAAITKQTLTIEGRSSNSDIIIEPEKELVDINVTAISSSWWGRISDTLKGSILTVVVCVVAYALRAYGFQYLFKTPEGTALDGLKNSASSNETSNPLTTDVPPVKMEITTVAEEVTASTVPPLEETVTPVHSRAQSTASASFSPRKPLKVATNSDEQSDGGSEDDEEAQNAENTAQTGEKKKKKTKRGVRGGRKKGKNNPGDLTTFEPKPFVSQERHLSNGMVQVGRLTYDSRLENCLGQGSSGTAVFPGTFDGRAVAVKRLVKTANSLAEKEIRHLVSSDQNPHVIRYHGKEESPSFFYIALDKFETSLDQFVEFPERYPSLVPPTKGYDVKDALRQITQGVQHIHSLKLVHRDIKPQNILVRAVQTARPVPEGQFPRLLFVISDFGLCKPLEDGPESVFAATRTAAGTTGWKAPELLVSSRDAIAAPTADSSHSHSRSTTTSSEGVVVDVPTGRRATKAIDIFSLGCVFFYVMTRGKHPFDKDGSPLARDLNIKEDNFDTSALRDNFFGYDYDADDLIMCMIMHNPKLRPDTAGVLAHPYFWKVENKLDYICLVSDNYEERKQKITNIHDENAPRTDQELAYLAELAALQAKAPDVIGTKRDGTIQDFLSALPRSFINEMGKQRKYTGTKMIDLLRVIRNKKNHFAGLPDDIQKMMTQNGRDPVEGYYDFWRQRFPSLLVNCHQLLLERGLVEEFGLQKYYDGSVS
ncbi:bifunctional endoribonuclease/protein kinase ire1 [Neophaeococcomyces mojaviensis]|uniref:Bifunctional endoribonuclease/protein kinase ire1 n=1 Tax=Neophaeococcomyces mojaviensis TaxID=3383035 RepID=A0ACC3A354_9EURO|nr:bifunctional endoribonuclease/protein kinase ire1 [Knufia sp. JES_112]